MTDNIFTTMTAPITTQAAAIQQAQTAAQQSQHPWVPPNTTVVIPGTSGAGQENKQSAQVQPGKTVVLANPTSVIVGGSQNSIAAPASVIAGKPVTIPSSAGLGNPQPPSTTDILVGAAAAASLVTNPVLVQGGGNRGVAPTPQAAGTTQAALNAKGTSTYNQYIIANAVSPDTKGQPSQITGQVETYQNWFTGVLGPLGANTIIDQPTTTLIGTILPAGSYLVLNPVSPLYSLSQVNQVYRGVYPSQGSPSGTTNVSLGVIVDKNFDIYTMNSSGVYVKTGQNYIAQQNAAVNLDTQGWISNAAKAGTVANVTVAHGGTGALNPGDAGYDGGFAANMANILSNQQAAAGIGGSVGINPITGNTEWIPTGQTALQAAQNLAGKPTLYEGAVYGAGLNYNVAVAQNAIAESAANAIAVTTGQVAINIGQGGNVSSITSGPYINAPISTPVSSILTPGSNLQSFNNLVTTGNAITASQQQATQQNQLYASLQQQGGINSLGQIVNPYNINTQRDQWYAFEKTADQYEAMTNTAATPQNVQNNPNYQNYIQIYATPTPGKPYPLSQAQQQAVTAEAGTNPAYAKYLESLWSGTLVQGASNTLTFGQAETLSAIQKSSGFSDAIMKQQYGVDMSGKTINGVYVPGLNDFLASVTAQQQIAQKSTAVNPGAISQTSTQVPSDADLYLMSLNIPFLSGALVAINDAIFGGGTIRTTTTNIVKTGGTKQSAGATSPIALPQYSLQTETTETPILSAFDTGFEKMFQAAGVQFITPEQMQYYQNKANTGLGGHIIADIAGTEYGLQTGFGTFTIETLATIPVGYAFGAVTQGLAPLIAGKITMGSETAAKAASVIGNTALKIGSAAVIGTSLYNIATAAPGEAQGMGALQFGASLAGFSAGYNLYSSKLSFADVYSFFDNLGLKFKGYTIDENGFAYKPGAIAPETGLTTYSKPVQTEFGGYLNGPTFLPSDTFTSVPGSLYYPAEGSNFWSFLNKAPESPYVTPDIRTPGISGYLTGPSNLWNTLQLTGRIALSDEDIQSLFNIRGAIPDVYRPQIQTVLDYNLGSTPAERYQVLTSLINPSGVKGLSEEQTLNQLARDRRVSNYIDQQLGTYQISSHFKPITVGGTTYPSYDQYIISQDSAAMRKFKQDWLMERRVQAEQGKWNVDILKENLRLSYSPVEMRAFERQYAEDRALELTRDIAGSNYVRSQLPKYPLLENLNSLQVQLSRARQATLHRPVKPHTVVSGDFWSLRSSGSHYLTSGISETPNLIATPTALVTNLGNASLANVIPPEPSLPGFPAGQQLQGAATQSNSVFVPQPQLSLEPFEDINKIRSKKTAYAEKPDFSSIDQLLSGIPESGKELARSYPSELIPQMQREISIKEKRRAAVEYAEPNRELADLLNNVFNRSILEQPEPTITAQLPRETELQNYIKYGTFVPPETIRRNQPISNFINRPNPNKENKRRPELVPFPISFPQASPFTQPQPKTSPFESPQPEPQPQPEPEPQPEPQPQLNPYPTPKTTTASPPLFPGLDFTEEKKKRKGPEYFIWKEISPVITPREIVGGGKRFKEFYRTINAETIAVQHPVSQEYRRRGLTGSEYENFSGDAVKDMSGVEFFRTATKKEGGPGVMRRQQNIDDVIRYIHTGNRQRKTTTPKQEKPQQEQSANGIRNFNNMVSGNIPIKRKQTNWW
jgi:hypothetical protein